MDRIFIDSFSGPAADLRGKARTSENVLAALKKHPRVSTWDMSEHAWLRRCIADLQRQGLITEDSTEPFPWHHYVVSASAEKAEENDGIQPQAPDEQRPRKKPCDCCPRAEEYNGYQSGLLSFTCPENCACHD